MATAAAFATANQMLHAARSGGIKATAQLEMVKIMWEKTSETNHINIKYWPWWLNWSFTF